MSFVEVQFPNSIAFKSVGGPEFLTSIVELKSGYEQRNINWSQARLSYNIASGIKTKTQLDELIKFFLARKGRAFGFRFKDWNDYFVIAENIGVGDGSTTTFQLKKTYTNGSVDYERKITKPVPETVKIYVDGVKITNGFSINTTTGIIMFDTAPAMGLVITTDFEFDVPVRFDVDKLDVSLHNFNSGEVQEIRVVEVRV
ncbi:DUF2460 domain-containing protein [Pseudomonadota bacterium]